uniref:Uncharacterized protein n=1 Tax=viral metagenome TaxID=1070528 RepID=A0A6M3LM91_9ZZZZ
MEENVKELDNRIREMSHIDSVTELTQLAQAIASNSLATFRGTLLTKALAITQSIVEFDIELNYPKEHQDG